MIKERLQLGAALEQAWKCPTVKERHFITPLALYSKRSYGASSSSAPSPGLWNAKGKGKSKSPRDPPKGKDKVQQEKSTAIGSTRACASTRVASSRIFAANASRRVTMLWTARRAARILRAPTDKCRMVEVKQFHRIWMAQKLVAECAVFYTFFSGSSRKGSVSAWAKKLGSRMGITVQVEMIDIKVRPNWTWPSQRADKFC